MPEQASYQLRWALFEPEDIQPHISGKTVVVGHTEQKDSEILDLGFAICIDTGCWRYGWLTGPGTAFTRFLAGQPLGVLREHQEPAHRGRLPAWVHTKTE